MANLSGMTSDKKQTSWNKYVVTVPTSLLPGYTNCNPGSALVDKKNVPIDLSYKVGALLTITSINLLEVGKIKLAQVKIGLQCGYMSISQINKPTTTANRISTKVNFGLLKIYQEGRTPVVKTKYILNTPTITETGELDFINRVNSVILSPITLKIGNITYDNICGVNKVAGIHKADLVFVSLIKNEFKEVCFVSHKKGKTPKNFGQWGGMTDRSGSAISNDPLVKKFIKQVKSTQDYTFKKMPATFTIIKKITGASGDNLKKRSMYGSNYPGNTGQDNVDFILQGNPSIRNGILNMDGAIHSNGTLINVLGFDPCLMACRRGTGERNQFNIPGARFVISPIGGRSAQFEILDDQPQYGDVLCYTEANKRVKVKIPD